MSGITLDDIANDQTMDTLPNLEDVEQEQPQQDNSRRNELIKRILTSETGSGSIEDYKQHAMNFNQSKGLARVLRGLTGLVGNLNLAIIDIALGALEFSKERNYNGNYGGYDNNH